MGEIEHALEKEEGAWCRKIQSESRSIFEVEAKMVRNMPAARRYHSDTLVRHLKDMNVM